jgi:5-methylcytosine-specific restriction enzyme subunit McrC
VLFNRVDIVASRYDDHTTDVAWNRAVKAALRAVRPWIVNGDLQRRWLELNAAMEDVANVHVTLADVQRLTFDRQTVRYTVVMNWVRWILALLSPMMRAGQESAPAFLFDMNRVFENAVANVLRRHFAHVLPVYTISAPGAGRHLTRLRVGSGSRAFALKPDVLIRQGREIRLVADAKWKRLKARPSGVLKPTRADMYQMHAYASAFEASSLMLIYPAHDGLLGATETAFELPDTNGRRPIVNIACVDVEKDGLPFTFGAGTLSLGTVAL